MTLPKTTIDWLRFRAKAEPRDIVESLRPMYGVWADYLSLKHLDRGILGFQRGAQIMVADMAVGRMDFGGDSQRGWVRVDIPGQGCEWVKDWTAIAEVEALPAAEIKRLDIALTTWDGEITHETVVEAHRRGRFVTKGRPPALKTIESSDRFEGRTCYIGKREKADKFMRCYEKGFEMAAKYGVRDVSQVTEVDGKGIEDIYRCEVELKAESRPIPWEVVDRRDQYFAGAYPFCADVLPGVQADILMRRPERAPQTDLAAALEHCRTQYGPTLFTALMAYHGDIGAVWEKIVGKDHNTALLEAGVLMVDHE
jgi:phage replication initiation protein